MQPKMGPKVGPNIGKVGPKVPIAKGKGKGNAKFGKAPPKHVWYGSMRIPKLAGMQYIFMLELLVIRKRC